MEKDAFFVTLTYSDVALVSGGKKTGRSLSSWLNGIFGTCHKIPGGYLC
ncbi:hypothetical protein [uncultured Rummeliibacillus sp.]|nr:hypothetical protein [uncultured Rummeliibacillus sp.]